MMEKMMDYLEIREIEEILEIKRKKMRISKINIFEYLFLYFYFMCLFVNF